MKFFASLSLLALCSIACLAQESLEAKACFAKAGPQMELNRCASEEAGRADRELNKTYKAVLAKFAADPLAVSKIKIMQRAWVAYRDAYMAATYPATNKQEEYGSMYPMEADLLISDLTNTQIKALTRLLHSNDPL